MSMNQPGNIAELQRVVDRDRSHRNATLLLADCLLQMGQDRRGPRGQGSAPKPQGAPQSND